MTRAAPLIVLFVTLFGGALPAAEERPNILWISSEDHGPHLGCYGDAFATTPHADALARRGLRYTTCWSNAPVCAPARTTLITGMYATSCGAQHMRSMVPLPKEMKLFPRYLREAGYYCTNNSKEDYNVVKPSGTWDVSGPKAHWRNRKEGQPFFAVFNSTKSHESQIRKRPHQWVHDPAKVRVPAYHPDTKEIRENWAQYYDQVTEADADAGAVLAQLEKDGLADSTIVFYFADHGSGMPRNKRFCHNSGLQVPLIVHIPEKFKHLAPPDYKAGESTDRPVSFVDFAPTVLSLAGVEPPKWMEGVAFLGPHLKDRTTPLFGFRDRMDERYDLIRSARSGRWVYIRNYLPHLPYGQHVSYMFETPTTQVWKKLHDEGKLTKEQDIFWNQKPPEELYHLESDPDEVHNLAGSKEHAAILAKMRRALREHLYKTRDLGFLPEAEMLRRSAKSTPYEVGHAPDYLAAEILALAEAASQIDEPASDLPIVVDKIAEPYWRAMAYLMRGKAGVRGALEELRTLQNSPFPNVRIAAAEALARYGEKSDYDQAVSVLLDAANPGENGAIVPIAALNALDRLGPPTPAIAKQLASFPATGKSPHARYDDYAGRLLKDIK
jgi:uncharacterized sulfatase